MTYILCCQKLNKQAVMFLLCLAILPINLSAKEFIVGVEDVSYYPLFDFSSKDTSKPSFTRDLLKRFFELHDYEYRFLALPIKRFDKWFVEESIDFKFPDNFRWRNDKDNKLGITFSEPVIDLVAGTYVLKSRANTPRDDVKKLGTILGFYPTLWLDKIEKNQLQLLEESSPIGVVKHVLYGNVDATNIDSNVIRYNLNRLKQPGEIVLNKSIQHQVFSYHFSSIKYPEIIQEFNVFLKENNELVEQLKKKYNIHEDFN